MLDDPDTTLDLLDRHPNLVLLRTFSKVYGLCGLRVGFALCGSEDFPRAVNAVRQPFFCNAAAQAAAIEALRHQDAVAERVERAIVARVEVEAGLNALGIEPAESQANFCWFDLPAGRRRGGRRQGPRRSRGARAGRQGARQGRRAARDVRHASSERPFPRRPCRSPLSCASHDPVCRQRPHHLYVRASVFRLAIYLGARLTAPFSPPFRRAPRRTRPSGVQSSKGP